MNGRIGGDANLTKRGLKFAQALTQFMNFQRQEFRKQQLERFSSRLELKYNSLFNEDDVALLDSIPSEPNFAFGHQCLPVRLKPDNILMINYIQLNN